jgi:hypothetical protein
VQLLQRGDRSVYGLEGLFSGREHTVGDGHIAHPGGVSGEDATAGVLNRRAECGIHSQPHLEGAAADDRAGASGGRPGRSPTLTAFVPSDALPRSVVSGRPARKTSTRSSLPQPHAFHARIIRESRTHPPGFDTTLTPPGAQYRATHSKAEKRKQLIYALSARPCKLLQHSETADRSLVMSRSAVRVRSSALVFACPWWLGCGLLPLQSVLDGLITGHLPSFRPRFCPHPFIEAVARVGHLMLVE